MFIGTTDRNDNAWMLILKALKLQGKRQTNNLTVKLE